MEEAETASFWDLDLVCVDAATSEDRRLPPLRVRVRSKSPPATAAEDIGENGGDVGVESSPVASAAEADLSAAKVEGNEKGESLWRGLKGRAKAAAARYVTGIRNKLVAAAEDSNAGADAGKKDDGDRN